MIQTLNSNKLKVDFITLNIATRGKINHKYEQTKKMIVTSGFLSLEMSGGTLKSNRSFKQKFGAFL